MGFTSGFASVVSIIVQVPLFVCFLLETFKYIQFTEILNFLPLSGFLLFPCILSPVLCPQDCSMLLFSTHLFAPKTTLNSFKCACSTFWLLYVELAPCRFHFSLFSFHILDRNQFRVCLMLCSWGSNFYVKLALLLVIFGTWRVSSAVREVQSNFYVVSSTFGLERVLSRYSGNEWKVLVRISTCRASIGFLSNLRVGPDVAVVKFPR